MAAVSSKSQIGAESDYITTTFSVSGPQGCLGLTSAIFGGDNSIDTTDKAIGYIVLL